MTQYRLINQIISRYFGIYKARLELKNYSITIKSQYLFIYNNITKRTDSISTNIDTYLINEIEIKDFTDSLHFKHLVIGVTYSGDSDQPTTDFFELTDTLKQTFSIVNLESLNGSMNQH